MQIIVGKTAGFCFGVRNAVDKTLKEIENESEIQCLGELVHNTQVTEELAKSGIEFIDNIEQAKQKIIIRSHGVTKEIYEIAKKKGIEIIDLTCPKVLNIHEISRKYAKENWYIFLVGQEEHPETIGTISFCGDNYSLIQSEDNLTIEIQRFKDSTCKNAVLISQTTYSLEKFEKISNVLQNEIPNIQIENTICNATRLRQEETAEISKNVDLMIIIGSKHSSNSNKLYQISNKYCRHTIFVETKYDVDIDYLKGFSKIGIMAGASTPSKSIEELIDIIKKTC